MIKTVSTPPSDWSLGWSTSPPIQKPMVPVNLGQYGGPGAYAAVNADKEAYLWYTWDGVGVPPKAGNGTLYVYAANPGAKPEVAKTKKVVIPNVVCPPDWKLLCLPKAKVPDGYPVALKNKFNLDSGIQAFEEIAVFKTSTWEPDVYYNNDVWTLVPDYIKYCTSCEQTENQNDDKSPLPMWPYANSSYEQEVEEESTEYTYLAMYDLSWAKDGNVVFRTSNPKGVAAGTAKVAYNAKKIIVSPGTRSILRGYPGVVRLPKATLAEAS